MTLLTECIDFHDTSKTGFKNYLYLSLSLFYWESFRHVTSSEWVKVDSHPARIPQKSCDPQDSPENVSLCSLSTLFWTVLVTKTDIYTQNTHTQISNICGEWSSGSRGVWLHPPWGAGVVWGGTAGCRDPTRSRSRERWRPSLRAHLTDVKHSVCDVHEGFPHAARRRQTHTCGSHSWVLRTKVTAAGSPAGNKEMVSL